ncbi:MAG: 5-formyltetrahydrofolate cyclo-ligase [Pseudomonadota bacterium]
MKMTTDLAQWRKSQRTELLNRRQAAAVADRQLWNETITALLEHGFPILQKLVVGFCWPYKAEFDARPVAHFLHNHGSRLALPAVVSANAPLQFHEWWPDVAMKPGAFELPVPDNTKILMPDALLIPAVGFGEQGDRLGYGGGFFDRTLAAMAPQPLKIGVAFELSRMLTTYPQAHDIPMDFIVTEAGIHIIENGSMRLVDTVECAMVSRNIVTERQLQRGL